MTKINIKNYKYKNVIQNIYILLHLHAYDNVSSIYHSYYSCDLIHVIFLTCQRLEQSLTWDHPSAGHDCFCFSLSWSARKDMLKAPAVCFPTHEYSPP